MPFSSYAGKEIIKEWFAQQTDIRTIVDLGPGSGTYPDALDKEGGKYIWKAVEIWGPYIKRFDLEKYYDEIRIGDIRYMDLPEGDCCIAGDVLEHLSREDMIKVFKKIDKQFKHVVISIPLDLPCDDTWEGNPWEAHKSIWSLEELNKLIPPAYKIREIEGNIAVFIK